MGTKRGARRAGGRGGRRGRAPRTERLNHVLQEIVAEELVRIDDERLGLVTIVAVDVDGDLRRATVWYTSLSGDESDEHLVATLEQHRPRLQAAVAQQIRIRRTPELVFVPDEMTRQAERIEDILREMDLPDRET